MTTPLDVRCPHEGCGAEAGLHCPDWWDDEDGVWAWGEFHPERIAAANAVEEEK